MTFSRDTAGVRIRRAISDDREFVLGLVPQLNSFGPPSWRDEQQMVAVDQQVIGRVLDGHSPDAHVLIAEDGRGQRVGFIHMCEEGDYYGGACGHVGDIVVVPEARGQGVGRALLAAAEEWARTQGYSLLTLNVFLANERAQALYEEIGFQPESVRLVKQVQ